MKLVLKNEKELYPLQGPLFSFGKDSSCQYVVPQLKDELSFQILDKQGQKTIMRLGQSALYVNQKSIDLGNLSIGDEISIDGCSWVFHSLNAEKESPFASFLDIAESLLEESKTENIWQSLPRLATLALEADHCVLQPPDGNPFSFPQESIPLSKSLIARSLKEQKVLCWNESTEESTHSIEQNQLTSVMVGSLGKESYLYLQRQKGTKPFSQVEESLFAKFLSFVAKLIEERNSHLELQEEVQILRDVKKEKGLLYCSEAMEKAVALANRAAKLSMPILLRGETGTGKEEFAKMIHSISPQKEKGYWALNCGAISESLIESELFGHKKGAFTGAIEDKEGIFVKCNGGSLFLDEIGELPMSLQVKLLRVLQEKKVTPVGSNEELDVDFRLISATHVDLEQAIQDKVFREDLFYRINVVPVELPPLRVRGKEILMLAEHFLKRFAVEYSMKGLSFSEAARKAMLKHSWPGNVRELKNRIQKSLVLSDSSKIEAAHLEVEKAKGSNLKEAREKAEREVCSRALLDAQGNVTLASDILGIDRKVLRELLNKLNIDKNDFKGSE